ncbi:hypothetical protein ACNOYE_00700 [Nannocystaceae bacterium ST9]
MLRICRSLPLCLLALASACGDDRTSTTNDELGDGDGDGNTEVGSTSETGSEGNQSSSDDSSSSVDESSDASTSDSTSTSDDDGPKFDLATADFGGDTGDPCQGGGMGDLEFSFIWIANSPQGTVSKIDTQTLVEEARYQVRPQGGGEPSRTSVNVRGDMVVGARGGGVTKIWARQEDCADDNGTPGIQTSTGKNDVLAWGQEECVAWYTDFAYTSERAIAWTAGTYDEGTCTYADAKVWVGGTNDASNLQISRLNGDTGVVEDMVQIPGTVGYMERSPYGAAVDIEGNGWFVNAYCGGTLVRVDYDDLSYDLINPPAEVCPYGITVDSQGYVWIGGYQTYTGRYDPAADQWDLVQAQGLGIQEDAQGRLWLGAYGQNGVYAIDGDTLQVLSYTPVPTTGQSKGVAIDFFGYVWVVSDAGNVAVRLDPDTLEIQTYAGLDSPYSYSDMTGWGLKNAAVDPQG